MLSWCGEVGHIDLCALDDGRALEGTHLISFFVSSCVSFLVNETPQVAFLDFRATFVCSSGSSKSHVISVIGSKSSRLIMAQGDNVNLRPQNLY